MTICLNAKLLFFLVVVVLIFEFSTVQSNFVSTIENEYLSIHFEEDQETRVLLEVFLKGFETAMKLMPCSVDATLNRISDVVRPNFQELINQHILRDKMDPQSFEIEIKYSQLKERKHDLRRLSDVESKTSIVDVDLSNIFEEQEIIKKGESKMNELQDLSTTENVGSPEGKQDPAVAFHLYFPRNNETIVLHQLAAIFGLEYANGTHQLQPAGEMCLYLNTKPQNLLGCEKINLGDHFTLLSHDAESWNMFAGQQTLLIDFTPEEANRSYYYSVTIQINIQPFNPLEKEKTIGVDEILAMPSIESQDQRESCVVTLLYGESYLAGVLTLHESLYLSGMSRFKFIVMTPINSGQSNSTRRTVLKKQTVTLLESRGIEIFPVDSIDLQPGTMLEDLGSEIWLKLRLWDSLQHYKSGIYLDADVIVLQNFEEIFKLDEFAGVGAYIPGGSFYFVPSQDIFDNMLRTLEVNDKYPYAEQDFLNHFFRNSKYVLSKEYHCWADHLGHSEHLGNCKIVEFASCGDMRWKPWMGKDALSEGERFCKNLPSDEFWQVYDVWIEMYEHALRRSNLTGLEELYGVE